MIELVAEGDVARLTLDRPAVRNAMRATDWLVLEERVGEAAASGFRVILLAGAGTAFCAGADLAELAALCDDVSGRAAFRQAMRRGIDAIAGSALPVMAAVGGDCHGAGVALAMACDIRVASAAARFSIPPARYGIAYPQDDVDRLVRSVGRGNAAALLLTGATIDAREAGRIGLVDSIAESAEAAAAGIAATIAANDATSVALLRRQIAGMPAAEADAAFDRCFSGDTFTKLAASIRAKR